MNHIKLFKLLLLLPLLFCKSVSATAVEDGYFLDRLQVERYSDRTELVISFTSSLRYVQHSPSNMGKILTIQLAPLEYTTSGGSTFEGKNRLVWRPTADLPLTEIISSQSRGGKPDLILRFKTPVSFKIKGDSEHRSLIIQLPTAVIQKPVSSDPSKAEWPQPTAQLPDGTGPFVINLLSMQSPIDSKKIASQHKLLSKYHLYQSQSRFKEKSYYRLRLGFFSKRAAARLLPEIKRLDPDFSSAWISQVSEDERERITGNQKERKIPAATTPVESLDPASSLPPATPEELTQRMESARKAILDRQYNRAIVIYSDIIEYPVQPFRRDAQELLGMAYERKGQFAHAKRNYEQYLKLYPEGEASDRVRQRLAGLVTASLQEREKLREAKVADETVEWESYGSFSQYYQNNISETGDTGSETTDSSLSSDLDLNARRRSKAVDMRFRFTGGYDNDFLDSSENSGRISSLYLDISTRNKKQNGRIGRQTRTSGGVLGRFDGIYYGYQFHPRGRINLVTGGLVESTSDSLATDRTFNGISLDWGPVNENWNFNLFMIDQRLANGFVDRQAIGGEARHFNPQHSLFLLADYDIHFGALNIGYLLGSWAMTPKTTLNYMIDYRMSPLLTTSNALQSQKAKDIDQLNDSYSRSEIQQLAEDRTAVSKSASLGLSHTLSAHWQITGDVTLTNMASTKTSGGVEANPSTGNEVFLSSQLVGNGLFKEGDLMIYGLRYSDTSSHQKTSLSANVRYPIQRHWRVNPRLRVDYKENDNNTSQTVWVPSFRTSYRWKRLATFELELGIEITEDQLENNTEHSNYLFAYGGYRLDF